MASAATKLGAALGGLLLAGVAAAAAIAAAAPEEKIIAVSAMKFEFLPATINLKKGEPVESLRDRPDEEELAAVARDRAVQRQL